MVKITSKIVFGALGLLFGGSAIFNGIAEQLKKKTDEDTDETVETVETSTTTTEET